MFCEASIRIKTSSASTFNTTICDTVDRTDLEVHSVLQLTAPKEIKQPKTRRVCHYSHA